MTSSEVVPVTEHWSLQKGKEFVKVVLPPSEWSPNSMVRRLRNATIFASFAAMFCVFIVVLDLHSGKDTGFMIGNALCVFINLISAREFHNRRKQELDKSRTRSYSDPVAVALLNRLPPEVDTDPAGLLEAVAIFSDSNIEGSPTTPSDTVAELLEDDEFVDGVMEIVWTLVSTNNPETVNHAREGIHAMAEALEVKWTKLAIELAELEKLATLDTVAEVATIAGVDAAELVELARRGEYAPWHAPELPDPFGEGANTSDDDAFGEKDDDLYNFDFSSDNYEFEPPRPAMKRRRVPPHQVAVSRRRVVPRQVAVSRRRVVGQKDRELPERPRLEKVEPPAEPEQPLPTRFRKLVRKLDGLVPERDDDRFTLKEALLLMLTQTEQERHKVTLGELLVVADDPHFRHLMVGTVSKLMHEGTKDSLLQACGDSLRMYHSLQGELAKQRAVKMLVEHPSVLPIKQFGVDKDEPLPVERPKVTTRGDDEFSLDDRSF